MNKRKTVVLGIMLISCLIFVSSISAEDYSLDNITAYVREQSYHEYLDHYPEALKPQTEIIIPAHSYSDTNMDLEIVPGFAGYDQDVIITTETGYVEWSFFVEEAGLYNVALKYYPIEGRGVDLEREILINGERPFDNAQYLTFSRIWGDATDILVDSLGNEIRAQQIEKPQWTEAAIRDPLGYVQEPYSFYFKEGINTLRLNSRMESMGLAQIKLYQEQRPPTYVEALEEYQKNGYQATEGIALKVQGEESILRSSPSLFPISDHGDPTVEPYHHAEIRLNSIGGYRWSQPGQWIKWELDVPESGLYKIAFKSKQSEKVGAFSMRKLYINDVVPFEEVESIIFHYSSNYNMTVLADPETEEPYLFYLPAGKNEIKLEVVLGDVGEVLNLTEEHLYELNTIYRRIIMITTGNPDPMRTYELDKRIPEVIERIGVQAGIYASLVDLFVAETGMEGEHTQSLTRMAWILSRMYNDPDRIANMLKEFRDGLGVLGTWIYETREQPLQIDYFVVSSPEQELPEAQPTFFQSLVHEVKAIVASFFRDYDLVGSIEGVYEVDESREPLTVWIGAGRDQAQVLKQLIDNEFSPSTGVPVKLQLVPDLSQLLIRAAIAGTAPDVAIGMQLQDPVNFGMRGALYNLSLFEDFEEVMGTSFMASSYVPFTFRDNVFAVAAQQSFPMMFYRKDILAELGLTVPETWDDLYRILPVLQKNGMSVGIRPSTYYTWLYQHGELIYKPDGVETNLDSEIAIQTFAELTDLFSLYDLLIEFNTENRFRLGEMPIVIEDYGLYNRLAIFAPELRGEWGMTLVPGTLQDDGTINHTVVGIITANPLSIAQAGIQGPATGILSNANDHDTAWEFVKWWISAPTQHEFGRELENLMGTAARYPTANIEAFSQLPWSIEEREALMKQWHWVEGSLEMPGGYYMGRMFDWAFRAVVVNDDFSTARETLTKYNMDINYELRLKREEFGLELTLDEVPQEYIDLFWSRFTHIKPKSDY